MSNDQTFGGLSREAITTCLRAVTHGLETLANDSAIARHKNALVELRALLAAPTPSDYLESCEAANKSLSALSEPSACAKSQVRPAAQDEPVGFLHRQFRDALDIRLGAISWEQESLFSTPVWLHPPMAPTLPPAGNWYAADDVDRHVRELDVLINGEEGAAPQAKLCDLVAQLQAKPVFGLDPAKGYAVVPIEPSPGLLMSMAIRSDHGLAVPGYYDQPLMLKGNHGIPHARLLECKLSEMRQIYEEVVGTGFYSPGKEAKYVAMNTEAQ